MTHDEVFRILALGDVDLASARWAALVADVRPVDPRADAVARIAALVALSANEAAFAVAVDAAIGAGLTTDDVVGVLLAVAPVVGSARLVEAAPDLAAALGIDVEALLEARGGADSTW